MLRNCQAHLPDHRLRGLKDVGRGEPEHAEACIYRAILPAVVGDQAVPVGGAAVLKPKPAVGVVKVRAAKETAG